MSILSGVEGPAMKLIVQGIFLRAGMSGSVLLAT